MRSAPSTRFTSPDDVLTGLSRDGLALVEIEPDPGRLIELANAIGATVVPHPDSGPDGVTVINDQDARTPQLAGFTRVALAPHTDRSGLVEPPDLLMTVCAARPDSGGELILVDGSAVHRDLAEHAPVALAALSTPRSALFGGADGHLGAVFTPKPDDVVAVRLRLDPLVRFNPAVARHLATLRAAIDRHTRIVPARTGVGYVLDNHRWLHGRRAYTGPRLLHRINAEARPGTILRGFRPTTPPTSAEAQHFYDVRPDEHRDVG